MSTITKGNIYRDPVITRLIEILEAEGPADMKGKWYYGNLYILPQNQNVLPCGWISQISDNATPDDTNSRDRSVKTYQINISVEMKRDWGKSSKAVETHMRLQRYLYGMDENYDWLPDSIMYLLRKHEVLDGQNRLYIDIGSTTQGSIQPGVEARGVGIFTYEGMVQFTVRHNQIRPGLGS